MSNITMSLSYLFQTFRQVDNYIEPITEWTNKVYSGFRRFYNEEGTPYGDSLEGLDEWITKVGAALVAHNDEYVNTHLPMFTWFISVMEEIPYIDYPGELYE